ncbi:hypothetical protein [Leisingera daeponensis]|uniref:hypothetical protein n=1 Tax=Leisingera daeponensis TaxID=405746 RepID=UPI0004803406|nr:hypothetical protein [Leisingera daeponensis]
MKLNIDPAEVELIGRPCDKTGMVRARYRGYEFEAKVLEFFRLHRFEPGAASEVMCLYPHGRPQKVAAETLTNLVAAMSNHERLEFLSATRQL